MKSTDQSAAEYDAAQPDPRKPETVSQYMARQGAKGGKAGVGAAKARKVTSKAARAAVNARWARYRAAKAKP